MASLPSSVASMGVSGLLGCEVPRVWTPPLRELTAETSRGFQCIAFAEDVLGVVLFPWQKWLLIHALELLPDGSFRFENVVLLVARQNGKSTMMQVLSLWRMYLDRRPPLIIGTAQNLDIAEHMWRGAVEMARSVPELSAEIENVRLDSGKKALELVSGSHYKVQAAGRRGGRGLSGDLVILDELREHQTWEAWSAVAHTTLARSGSQVWAASNAGDRSSVVLAHLRMTAHIALGDPDGLAGGEVAPDEIGELADESLGIFEWSAAPGSALDDRAAWAQANPSLGYSGLSERKILSAMKSDPERVFRTEVLCQWVDSMSEGAFPPGVWESTFAESDCRITGRPVVGVELRTGMQQSAAIMVAGSTDFGHDLFEVARYELGADEQWAQDYILTELLKILETHSLSEVVLDKFGENATLIPLLEDAGITVIKLDTTDMRNACVGVQDALINGRLKHRRIDANQPLDVAVLGAGKRFTNEQFVWSQARSTTDITTLRAGTAAWWVHRSMDSADKDPLAEIF